MNQGNGMPVNRQGMEELLLGGSGASSVSVLSVGYSDNPENQLEMNLEDLTDSDYRRYLEKAERLNTPSLSNEFIREAVLEQAANCATGAITAKEAAGNVVDKVKLFLSEG